MAKYDFGPARVDFSAIGNLGQAFFEPYDKAKKQSALDALGRDVEVGNYRAAAAKAAQAGNPELVKALIGFEEKRRELAQKQGGLSGRASLGGNAMRATVPRAMASPGNVPGAPGPRAFNREIRAAESEREVTGLQTPPLAPSYGDLQEGYRFRGGDPSRPENWVKVD